MKAYRVIHVTANIIAFGLLGWFLVYFLINYDSLPARIGVHFSAVNGELDVFSDKIFGFYPFVMGFGLMLLFSLLTIIVRKLKKLGLKVTEEGSRVFRCAAALMLDVMKLTWAAFFSYWTWCIVHQTSMGDGTLLDIFRVFFIILLLSIPALFSRIQDKYRLTLREEKARTAAAKPISFVIPHIILNVISFGALGVFLVWFLIAYESLPERIGVHFAGDGSFDVYSYRIFGMYPFVAGFGLLIIFSLLTLAVNKIKRIGLNIDDTGEFKIRLNVIETLDALKLIWSAFFSVWAWCVIHQTGMDTTLMSILMISFLALFPVTAAVILITARKHRIKDNKENEQK